MKKFIKIIFIITVCFLLAACNRVNDNNESALTIDPGAPGVPVERPPEFGGIEWPESGFYFTLTDEEQAVYERFLVELSTDVFAGLSPISVAKISIQAGIDGEWEAEWYSHSPTGMGRTKEDAYAMHREDIELFSIDTRRSQANWAFPFIDYATVLERGNEVTLIFHAVPNPDGDPEFYFVDTITPFTLIRNDRGIWEVRFRPHAMDDDLMDEIEGMLGELKETWTELMERIGISVG